MRINKPDTYNLIIFIITKTVFQRFTIVVVVTLLFIKKWLIVQYKSLLKILFQVCTLRKFFNFSSNWKMSMSIYTTSFSLKEMIDSWLSGLHHILSDLITMIKRNRYWTPLTPEHVNTCPIPLYFTIAICDVLAFNLFFYIGLINNRLNHKHSAISSNKHGFKS